MSRSNSRKTVLIILGSHSFFSTLLFFNEHDNATENIHFDRDGVNSICHDSDDGTWRRLLNDSKDDDGVYGGPTMSIICQQKHRCSKLHHHPHFLCIQIKIEMVIQQLILISQRQVILMNKTF